MGKCVLEGGAGKNKGLEVRGHGEGERPASSHPG